MSVRHLGRLLEPRSVAVVGASDRPASVGGTVWRNLHRSGFAGRVHAVNPHRDVLDGAVVWPSVARLPEAPDLAVICTPPGTVPGLVADLGERGTKAAIVMTAGLDAAMRQATLDAARPHVLRVLGPDCVGLLTPRLGLNASVAHTDALPGNLAFLSQSGTLVTTVLDWAKARGIGFSHLVSVGDRADVDFGDLLDHLASDAHTRAILLYLESVEMPRKFMSAARAAARNKPVIMVKAGRSAEGTPAASSHTGSLVGSDAVFDAAIRRAGMLRVDTLHELFVAAETLARFRGKPEGPLAVMTNGRGAGVLAADFAARVGVPLLEPSPALKVALDAVLPPAGSRTHPIDIGGDATAARYVDTLRTLLSDPAVGAVLFMHAPTPIVSPADLARACASLVRAAAGRVLACWLGEAAAAEARSLFEADGVADYATPEEAVGATAMLATYRRNQALLGEAPTAREAAPPDVEGARRIVRGALAEGRDLLDEAEGLALLAAYGIGTVPAIAVGLDPEEAVAAARRVGYPVVLKIRSRDLPHESEAGGVRLDIADDDALRAAARDMLAAVRSARPDVRVEGYVVQQFVRRPKAHELIVGAMVDATFGPVVLFGQGGTAVEVVGDRAVALPPLNRVLAREMVARTRVSKLLAGYRDHPPADLDAIVDALVAIAQMLAELPELVELDVNPLWADAAGVVALDARVRVGPCAGASGTARFAIVPYPAELARTVDWNGETLEVRPIRPEDDARHSAFLAHLSAEDLRLRFFSIVRELPRSQLARLVQIDYAREMAFIALRPGAGGAAETLGVARAVADPDNDEAEFAVVVRTDVKGGGLGRLLMRRLIEYQRSIGTRRLIGDVLRENRPMRELAHRLGFRVDPAFCTEESVRVVLELQSSAAALPEASVAA
jgi:acetyltransferase